MIKYHKCKTAKCEEQSTHTNPINGFCYCSKCALRLHSLDQCKRIGDPEIINYALSTSVNMITKMKEYIERKDLSDSWNYMIPELDHFEESYLRIRKSYQDALSSNSVNMLTSLEEESCSLKNIIERSEIYFKYLNYKESYSQMTQERNILSFQEFSIEDIVGERVNRELNYLNSKFKCELNELKRSCLSKYNTQINNIQRNYEANLSQIEINNKQIIDDLEQTHLEEITKLNKRYNEEGVKEKKQHSNEIQTLKKDYEIQLEDASKLQYKNLKKKEQKHNKKLDEIKESHSIEIENLHKEYSEKFQKQNDKNLAKIDQLKEYFSNEIEDLKKNHIKSIEKLSNEKDVLSKKLLKTKAKLKGLVKSSPIHLPLLTYSELSQKYNEITGEVKSFKQNDKLSIDMDKEVGKKLVEVLSQFSLPVCKEIIIQRAPTASCPKEILSFLQNSVSCPELGEEQSVWFNECNEDEFEAEVDCLKYLIPLLSVAPKINKSFYIYSMKITNSEFCSLVSAGKNSEEIKFSACTILTDVECDFGEMENSRIQTLDFFQSGSSNKSNWKSKFGRFINIIIGISISNGLKQCLEEIVIKDCELEQSKAKNILETYRLDINISN